MPSYRKIWEESNGEIPHDNDGRRMEIHHIDGNRANNSLTNLRLVTISEHYEIHHKQGDWAACQSILNRMAVSPEEKSKVCSELAQQRVKDGTHPFQNPEFIKKDSERKSRDRSGKNHPLYNKPVSESTRHKRSQSHKHLVDQGLHHLQDDEHRIRMRNKANSELERGIHPFQQIAVRERLNEKQNELIKNKTHAFNHPNRIDPNKIMVFCSHCQKEVTKPVFGRFHKH
jgi:hypothetical protein